MNLPNDVSILTWEATSPHPVRLHIGDKAKGLSPDEDEVIGHALILTAQQCRRDEQRFHERNRQAFDTQHPPRH